MHAEKQRTTAETQLGHVRMQMGQALQPMSAYLGTALVHKQNCDYELGLSFGTLYSQANGGPVRPLVLSPEAEMHSGNMSPKAMGCGQSSSLVVDSTTYDANVTVTHVAGLCCKPRLLSTALPTSKCCRRMIRS